MRVRVVSVEESNSLRCDVIVTLDVDGEHRRVECDSSFRSTPVGVELEMIGERHQSEPFAMTQTKWRIPKL